METLQGELPSQVYEDIFSKCLLCGACVKACPRGVDSVAETRHAREGFSALYGEYGYQKFLVKKVLEQPELLSVGRHFGRMFGRLLDKKLPQDSGLRLRLAMLDHPGPEPAQGSTVDPELLVPSSDAVWYFPGCSASYLYPGIIESAENLFRHCNIELVKPEGLACCGLPFESSGEVKRAKKLARKNISLLEGREKIVVSCGSCYAQLAHYPQLLKDDPGWYKRAEDFAARLVEMSCYLDSLLEDGQADMEKDGPDTTRVFYHDPCHLRNDHEIVEEPRALLGRFDGIELLELEDGPQCCGQGGLFHIGAPELSAAIRNDLAGKVLEMNPQIITSSCSGCLMQWKSALAAAGRKDIEVLHLADLLGRLM